MARSLSTQPGVRALLRVDAAFEGVLAVGCLGLAYRLPSVGGWALPSRLGRPLLIVLAVVLLVVGGMLLWLSERVDPSTLRAVALANGATALALLIFAGLSAGPGAWLRMVLVLVAVVLAGLAGVQFRLVRTP